MRRERGRGRGRGRGARGDAGEQRRHASDVSDEEDSFSDAREETFDGERVWSTCFYL